MPTRVLTRLLVGAALLVASPALAHPEGRRDAARAFAESTRAFDAGDYRRAAEGFEAAYALAPHEDALWNAARAWERAGEEARAANAYAHYLREAPPGARDRAAATSALKALSVKLARVELHVGAGVDEVSIDEDAVNGTTVFLVPGTHVFRANGKRGPIETQHTLRAGETTSVVLAAPFEPTRAPTTAPTSPAALRPDTTEPTRRRGWSPTIVWIGGGLAVAVGALATWSGLDTLSALHAFEAAPTEELLASGRTKQLRTNLLIGGAAGLAVLTSAAALWLVDWQDGSTRIGIGATSRGAMVTGSF